MNPLGHSLPRGSPKASPYAVQWLFGTVVACCLAAGLSGSLRLAYPAGALVTGAYLLKESPGTYVAFTMWLWFLSPLVRRLVDYAAGWRDPSPILLAPYLVAALSLLPLIRRLAAPSNGSSVRERLQPAFLLTISGLLYGLLVGLVLNPISSVLTAVLNWAVPIAFGWYVAVFVECYLDFQRAITRTFQWGILIVGCYGIYQFIVAPPWDGSWLTNVGALSMGLPEPFGIRVFSTMHAPAILALTLAIGVVLWLAAPRLWTAPGAAVAIIAVLLSQARTAWVVLAIAILLLIPSLRPKLIARLVFCFGVLAALTIPLLTVEPMHTVVSDRLATLSMPSKDESAEARLEAHEYVFDQIIQQPFGYGLGASDDTFPKFTMLRDSIITSALTQLGFVGSVLYFFGLLFLLWELFACYRQRESPLTTVVASIAIALMSQLYLASTTAGPVGAFFWMLAGLALSRRHSGSGPSRIPVNSPVLNAGG